MPLKAVRVCKQKSFFLLNKLHHTFTVSTFFMRFKVPVGGMSRPHTLNPQGLPGGPSLPWEGFSPCQVLLVSLTLGLPIPFSGPHFATCLSGIPPSAPSASETRKHNILPCREVSPPSYYENGRGVHGKSRAYAFPVLHLVCSQERDLRLSGASHTEVAQTCTWPCLSTPALGPCEASSPRYH